MVYQLLLYICSFDVILVKVSLCIVLFAVNLIVVVNAVITIYKNMDLNKCDVIHHIIFRRW